MYNWTRPTPWEDIAETLRDARLQNRTEQVVLLHCVYDETFDYELSIILWHHGGTEVYLTEIHKRIMRRTTLGAFHLRIFKMAVAGLLDGAVAAFLSELEMQKTIFEEGLS
jgi:hypothetical protein